MTRLTGTTRTAVAVALAAGLTVGALTGADGAAAAPTNPGPVAPSNPSDQQLQGAAAQKASLDRQVGQLGGQIAQAQAQLQELQDAEENAEQDVAYTITKYRDAVAHYGATKRAAASALKAKSAEETRFAQYMQASYADGDIDGMTGSLLTASDPSALLRKTDYEQYAAERSAGVVGQMELATVRASNTKAAATRAKTAAGVAKRKAAEAQQQAEDAVADQQSQEASLQNTLNQRQAELVTARSQQAALYKDRATYVQYQRQLSEYHAYVAEQKRIAIAKAQAAAKARAAKAQAERERAAAARERAAEKAAEAKAKREGKTYHPKKKKKKHSSSSSRNDPPAPSSGGWTAAKGRQAVKRAKRYLGTMYAWAGGNRFGPTYGVCAPGDAANDCYVRGFDCSGLVLYAWNRSWDHLAHNQYIQAGSYHPKRSQLKPGDLLFFGGRGNGRRLHHVAIYVGNQKMIEAPESGVEIRISSIYRSDDYYGATRPLT